MYGRAEVDLLKLRVLHHSKKSQDRKNKKKRLKKPEIAKNDSTPMKTNGDLEFVNDLTGWELHMDREHADYSLDKQITYTGKPSLITVVHESQELIQLKHEDILADPYHGQRIRLVAYLKTENVEQASLYLGVSAPSLEPGGTFPAYYSADNQHPIEGTQDWQRHELVIDVPEDAYSLAPFFNMRSNGKVWLNGMHICVVDRSVPLTGTDLMAQPYPLNLDFSQGRSFWQLEGSGAREDYICGIEQREQGERYAFLTATVELLWTPLSSPKKRCWKDTPFSLFMMA